MRRRDSDQKLTKEDIGQPQNFRHLTHIGWDANSGFQLDDTQVEQFFVKAGVTESDLLQDSEKRKSMNNFCIENGGFETSEEQVGKVMIAPSVSTPPPDPVANKRSSMDQKKRRAPPPPPLASPLPTQDLTVPIVSGESIFDFNTHRGDLQGAQEEASDSLSQVQTPSAPPLDELEASEDTGTPPASLNDYEGMTSPPPTQQTAVIPPVPSPRKVISGGDMNTTLLTSPRPVPLPRSKKELECKSNV